MQFFITSFFIQAVSIYQYCSCQSFSTQPQGGLSLKGGDITLTCQAIGVINPTYYWLKDGSNVTRGTSGFTNSNAFLTISSLTFSDTGSYACRAVGSGITITSSRAVVTIEGSPEIVQPPSATTSHEGLTVLLTCGTISNPQPIITWSYNSVQISSSGRFTIFTNGSLAINTLTKADAGTYSCRAKNSYGEDSGFAVLTVLDPPSPPSFTTSPTNTSATEGTTVTFYCQATGSPLPAINWTRVGASIPSDRQSQPQPGALQILSLKPSDDGLYACVAKNSQGQKVAYVSLRIKGYPKFAISPSNKVVKEGHSVLFNCSATSDPEPTISWQLPNGTTVFRETAKSRNVQVLANDTLSIAVVNEQDEGNYVCIAKNSVGTRKVEAKLSVLTIPRFTTPLQNSTKTRGQDFLIMCPARANPSPNFQWFFGGNVIGTSQQLRLTSLQVINEGTYTCRVNNTMGVATGALYLRVIVIPTITFKPSSQTIGLGATAKFSCQSSGDPAPSVSWYKDGAQVQLVPRYFILSNDTLVITNAVDSDKGWFTCFARNAAGSAQEKAYLFVTDLPKFTKQPSSTSVDVTKEVVLACRAGAKETPTITWYKVGQSGTLTQVPSANVQASGDMLIKRTDRSDRSNYVCRACNAAGCVQTSQVMLNVLYYPSFLIPPKGVGVLQGQDAVLKCQPDASPKANIKWRLPNGEIFGGNDYTQIIRDVQPSKTGDYKCEAENYLGKAGPVIIRLRIETKAIIVDLTKVSTGQTETITCEVNGDPLPEIKWYIGKDPLPHNAKYPNYIVTFPDKKLQVPIGSLDRERFWCNATNPQNAEGYLVRAPFTPTSTSTKQITSSSITVTWIRPSLQYLITHYQLEKRSADSSWELVNGNIKDLSYTVRRLLPFTVYHFRLKAVNGLGVSNYSMTTSNVTTLSSTPSVPRNVTTYVISPSEIKVTWSTPQYLNGPLDDVKYRVMYSPSLPNITNDFNISHDQARDPQMFLVKDLQADILYSIKVFAWRRRQDGRTFISSGVASSALTLQIVPTTPPIGLIIVSNGPYQIIVKWKKPPYSVRGYNIMFMQNVPSANFTRINIPNGSTTTYVITDLKEDTFYLVKVQMYSNVDDEGPFSEVAEVRTETDKFGAIAGQSKGEKSVSWEVAVGGLVCGLLLLVIVVLIVWCWLKRTKQTNNTFQISTRRRRAPSSIASNESVEGHYNIVAFNSELDTDLDLEMFTQQGNVVPISTSFRNEHAISYTNPRLLHEGGSKDVQQQQQQQSERIYHNQNKSQGELKLKQNEVIYDNNFSKERIETSKNTRSNIYDNTPISNGNTNEAFESDDDNTKSLTVPVDQAPAYAQVDMSKKTRKLSEDSAPGVPPFPDDLSDDISDVPYPDEELPEIERRWTIVSEFNFPPPPDDPPPTEPEEDVETPREDDTPNIVPLHEEPSYKPHTNEASGIGKGLKKRRMIASWAEMEDEPMGNLWETVDKELDRRLGTT